NRPVAVSADNGRGGSAIPKRRCTAPVTFFATARKVSGRNGKRSACPGLPRTRTTNPKQERKSHHEKQKKYPDLHCRRSRHPCGLGEFILEHSAAPGSRKLHWQTYARRVRLLCGPDPESTGLRCRWHMGSSHRENDGTTGPAAG